MLLIIKSDLLPCGKQEAIPDFSRSELLLNAGESSPLFSDVHGKIRKDVHQMAAEDQRGSLSRKPGDLLFNLKVVDLDNHPARGGLLV